MSKKIKESPVETKKSTVKEKPVKNNDKAINAKDLKQVQDHYLDYPYPMRNPEDDKVRLLKVYGDYLGEINHWLFEGKKDFTKKFRVLIAGGGTGDSTVYLAEQLKDTDAEVVYLDFSKNSMDIAQKRAEYRGVKDKITWINDSIFNIPKLKLGKFDYITCTGVLHHLESPDAGLKVLADSLTEDGGMAIMVYAQYGRTGVYQIQDMLRMINQGVTSRQEEVKNGWAAVNALPNTNWYKRGADLLGDHINHGDIGMYDMFLHKQDRAYTVPQLYDFVENAGLNFVEYNSAHSRIMLKPETYFKDPEFLKKIKSLDEKTQAAICEIMCGSIIKHSFYVSKKKKPVAKFSNMDNVPCIYTIYNLPQQISDYIKENPNLVNTRMNFSWKSDFLGDVTINITVSKYTEYLFKHMVGATKSFKEIHQGIEKDLGIKISESEFMGEINRIFPAMEEAGVVLLRHKDVAIDSML
ncbi:MAG: class I SAM-dependent methyltransferase [Rickettsiales bacterium]|nr:MAG: class I SAM-dependent methyltransferase [Rickettsiales bacterium]